MGLDDRDYMRERRRRERGLGGGAWHDGSARVEQPKAWFEPENRGHDYGRDRYRSAAFVAPRAAQKWILFLSALLLAIPMYGAAKRDGLLPDMEPGEPFPASGSVTVARALDPRAATSSLEVQASNANAVVQLFDRVTGQHVITIYVAADHRARIPVPSGTFQLRLIEGQKWHGQTRYFGPNTSYETVVRPMTFDRGSGRTIDLRRRPDGNLPTRMNVTAPERV